MSITNPSVTEPSTDNASQTIATSAVINDSIEGPQLSNEPTTSHVDNPVQPTPSKFLQDLIPPGNLNASFPPNLVQQQLNTMRLSVLKVPPMWSSQNNITTYFKVLDNFFSANKVIDENARYSLLITNLTEQQTNQFQTAVTQSSDSTTPYTTLKQLMIEQINSTKSSWITALNDVTFSPNESAFQLLQKLLSMCPRKAEADPTMREVVENKFLSLLPYTVRPLIRATQFKTLEEMAKFYDRYAKDVTQAPSQTGKSLEIAQLQAKMDELLMFMSRQKQPSYPNNPNNQQRGFSYGQSQRYNYPQRNFYQRQPQNYRPPYEPNNQQFAYNKQRCDNPRQNNESDSVPTDTRPVYERNPQFIEQ
uniref:Filamin-A n=1 Tax=Phallusia mammillata TaxID=59560 RepID=A0A6F9DDF8_9ASCI|nr:filamin-A [Phallusia mammillata]